MTTPIVAPMTRRRTLRDIVRDLEKRLAELEARETRIEEKVSLSLPKATRRTAAPLAKNNQPIPVVRPEPEAPLLRRIEELLSERILSYHEIVEELGEGNGHLHSAFQAAVRRGQIYNVGDDARPRWSWVPGDAMATPQLNALIERLVRERPMSRADLELATGANPNRISRACTNLKERGVHNLGSERRALWFLPSNMPQYTRTRGRQTRR